MAFWQRDLVQSLLCDPIMKLTVPFNHRIMTESLSYALVNQTSIFEQVFSFVYLFCYYQGSTSWYQVPSYYNIDMQFSTYKINYKVSTWYEIPYRYETSMVW